jgi:hypothetical protein
LGGGVNRVEQIGRITAIYALCEPDNAPRYVGKTVRYLHERHKQHIYDAQRRARLPVHRWIAKRIREQKPLVIRLLEYVRPSDDWTARERHWIETLRASGCDLLNLTKGGEGLPGHRFTAEHRAKIAAALKTGDTFACEQCGSTFWRKRKDIQAGNNRFCSRSCYATSLRGKSRPVSESCKTAGIAAAAIARRTRTHCKRGHPLSGDNMFRTASGSRGCKECRKIHKATYRSKGNG